MGRATHCGVFGALCVLMETFAFSGVQATPLDNPEAVIPPQCYTKTEGAYNPCYICHQSHPKGSRVNTLDDGELQGSYNFSAFGVKNRWSNLHKAIDDKDRLPTDLEMLAYVREDNYQALYKELKTRRHYEWIALQNLGLGKRAFDAQGFAKDGSHWIAFNYKPVPSSFWPTNGSADDVMIRLPAVFRQTEKGVYSRQIYLLNLSLVEIAIKDLQSIQIPDTDEQRLGLDLDGNGKLNRTTVLERRGNYIGGAVNIALQRQLYPTGTEFLHTLRYLNVTDRGNVVASRRLKEIRYTVKYKDLSEAALRYMYNIEKREKDQGRLPKYAWAKPVNRAGLNNKMGWNVQSWVEDSAGALRLASYEENLFCMGCHTTIGTTIDQSFAFPRKLDGAQGWGYINLRGMRDAPSFNEQDGEYLTYLKRVGGGDEFRQNQEMLIRWFDASGRLKSHELKNTDVKTLVMPSSQRAMALNKAYWRIVQEQSFTFGRDTVLGTAEHVFKKIDPENVPVLPVQRRYHYDLRLNWNAVR
ncbi:hypothetical protein P886_1672 [Alteromonadaceae bacterium 2753L.S.0a.02]|nr:hypothetical protein P886_1672 [Alteromonadaceae bacterium 2753L.S.0a.02]